MRRERLIRRREELGLNREAVAERLGVDVSTIVRMEQGRTTPRVGRRPALARILEWTPAQLALSLDDEPTPTPNGHQVPAWLGHLASLEQGAARLWSFEPVVVHGLLQTDAYAAAVERVGPGSVNEEEVARRVDLRIARQGVLTRDPGPLQLSVVLDESVLHRIAGDRDVMADQLDHLADMAVCPNVELQVLPLEAGVFSAAFGAFKVLSSPGSPEPYMACVEDRAGPHYLDRPHELDAHVELFEYLSGVALSPSESVDLVRTVAKENHDRTPVA